MKRSVAIAIAIVLASVLLAGTCRAGPGDHHRTRPRRRRDGQPMPDVQVRMEYTGHILQRYKTKTDKNGVFTHVNVFSGPYTITLSKEGVGEVTFKTNLQEIDRLQKPPDYKFVPKQAAAAPPPPPGSGMAAAGAPAPAANMGSLTTAINAAIALAKSGDTDGAIAAYEAILAQTPQIPLVHFNLASAYKKKGDAAKAEAELRKSIELDPAFIEGHIGLASLLAETGKRPEAVEVMKKAAEANPHSGRVQYALGVLAETSGDAASAKEAFLKTEQLDPQNVQAHYHLGIVALNQNDRAEALSRFQKFVASAPEGTPDLEVAKSLIATLQKK